MKKYLLLLLICLAPFAAVARELPKPQLMAVYFYADWCANCKILSPKYDEARSKGELDKKDILFVKLNLTDKTTIHQSILLASSLGIGEFLKAQGSATGYIALLDADTKKELVRLQSDSSSADIQKAFETYLKP